MPNTNPLLTAEDVAQRLNVHVETVRRWTRSGVLASVKLPGVKRGPVRYRAEDVEALVAGEVSA